MNNLLFIFGIANLVVMLIAGYMLFAPVHLSILYNEPFPIYPPEISRGEELHYIIEFEKRDTYHVETNRNIVCADGNLVTLAPIQSGAPLGRHTIDASIFIPEKTSLGECYLQLEATYYINPLRTEHREMRTQSFIIKE